jgi:hypothetical protein
MREDAIGTIIATRATINRRALPEASLMERADLPPWDDERSTLFTDLIVLLSDG